MILNKTDEATGTVTMNARFSDMNNRFDDLSRQMDTRIGDLRNQMQREHDNLSQKLDAHISDQTIHPPPRV